MRILRLLAIIATLCLPALPEAPKKPTPPDAVLQQKIQEKFAHAKAGGGKFTVRVQGGVAYLSGRADVAQHKGAATRMAKAAGAKSVVNNIQVSEAAKQKAIRKAEVKSPS
jgi:osmotically-inducible protein OsmY